jgi:elongation factor Ts
MPVSAELVKKLRERTGIGMMDCKRALDETDGDVEKAIEYLRKKGVAGAANRVDRATKEGVIATYVHPGEKLGVLIEVNCETDFVARTEAFRAFAKDLAMQVAATNPIAIKRDQIPPAVLEREKEIYRTQSRNEGKPEKILDKIVEGRLEKFYQEACLLEQPFVKDPERIINDLMTDLMAKTGENITIRRFVRYRLGGDDE